MVATSVIVLTSSMQHSLTDFCRYCSYIAFRNILQPFGSIGHDPSSKVSETPLSLSQAWSLNPLTRFITAQSGQDSVGYDEALAELRAGRKLTHWVWYVLPQLRALGRSAMAREYGLEGLDEAVAYAAHPVLGPRLVACVQAMLAHQGQRAEAILGPVDAMKFRSCLTLFERAAQDEPAWAQALERFYGGVRDEATLRLIGP
jgi:uncharacterized protein (DUF1810 family)